MDLHFNYWEEKILPIFHAKNILKRNIFFTIDIIEKGKIMAIKITTEIFIEKAKENTF